MMSMAFAFLCFAGILVMFVYLIRSLDRFEEHMHNEHAQLRVQLRALEARLEAQANAAPEASTEASTAPHAPLPDAAPLVLAPKDPLDAALEDPLVQFEPKL